MGDSVGVSSSISLVMISCRRLGKVQRNVIFFLIFAHPGLLIVDHIHFQYNGFLLGEASE